MAKTPVVEGWELGVLFDIQVIRGCVKGVRLTQQVLWLSDWTVGTQGGVFKLSSSPDWFWIKELKDEDASRNKVRVTSVRH